MNENEMRRKRDFQVSGYHLSNVFGRLDERLRGEIAQFWVGQQVLSRAEAARRAFEVVFTVRSAEGALVGVNTAYVADLREVGDRWYFYRMYLRPEDRGCFAVAVALIGQARAYLRTQVSAPGGDQPQGLVIVAENQKLWRTGMGRWLGRGGWLYLGNGPAGNAIWIDRFESSKPELSKVGEA